MADWVQSFQVGAQLADRAFDRRLRQQQLAGQEADRRLRERQLAGQLSQIDLENQKLSAEIADRAKQDAEWLNVNTEIAKARTAFEAAQDAGMQGPPVTEHDLRDEAAMRLAGQNVHAKQYLAGRVQAENFKADAARRAQEEALLPLRERTLEAQALQRETAASLNVTREQEVGKPRPGVEPEFQRLVEWLEKRQGKQFSETELKELADIRMGVKPRAAVIRPSITKPDYIARELPKLRTAEIQGELSPKKRRTDDQLRSELSRQYDAIYGESEQDSKRGVSKPTEAELGKLRDQIRADFHSGKISREEALKLLRETGLK